MRSPSRHRRPSLLFVQAVNFELTYQCNMSCSHCLQIGLRRTDGRKWIDTDVARKAIEDAHSAGFTKTGLNFTGGEIFQPESNLPELLETARSLSINVRVNTNGWWGNRSDIRVGSLNFTSAGQVVDWLREMNVAMLALSFDRRLEEKPDLWQPTIAVIRECENQGQYYQIILTGVETEMKRDAWCRLTMEAGIQPHHLIPVEMEMIDIGGAAGPAEIPFQISEFETALYSLPCEGKGFYRPTYLHISPDGGVRSCLYAPGAGWLGNIYYESLLQLKEKFKDNCVVEDFSKGDLSRTCESLIEPHAGIYRSVRHPCAVAVILSKVIEKCDRFKHDNKRKPSHEELKSIHQCIARELNLNKKLN